MGQCIAACHLQHNSSFDRAHEDSFRYYQCLQELPWIGRNTAIIVATYRTGLGQVSTMFKKLIKALGLQSESPVGAKPPYRPYGDSAASDIYNLIFCDDPDSFHAREGEEPTPWQTTLFGEPPNAKSIRKLADDKEAEGRFRYLACNRLRLLGEKVEKGILFGVIVEVPMTEGLDTLAAFSEGGVRYINHSGTIVVKEGPVGDIDEVVKQLMEASQKVVHQIGPWNRDRLPPPSYGRIRMSFLVSDGLYFGDGPTADMQTDPISRPVMDQATALMLKVTKLAMRPDGVDARHAD